MPTPDCPSSLPFPHVSQRPRRFPVITHLLLSMGENHVICTFGLCYETHPRIICTHTNFLKMVNRGKFHTAGPSVESQRLTHWTGTCGKVTRPWFGPGSSHQPRPKAAAGPQWEGSAGATTGSRKDWGMDPRVLGRLLHLSRGLTDPQRPVTAGEAHTACLFPAVRCHVWCEGHYESAISGRTAGPDN